MYSLKKTIPYTDTPKISKMMKECSCRAVSDKMNMGVVEKKKILRHRSLSYKNGDGPECVPAPPG
jgi:hypothetical protein